MSFSTGESDASPIDMDPPAIVPDMIPTAPSVPHPIYPTRPVGFNSITKQIQKKLVKRGFQFNLICVGQTGLGKSTLVNTLFASHLISSKGRLHENEPIRSTTEIEVVSHVLEEDGVRLRMNIVDTPGYGDNINNDHCWDPIVKYIKDQHSSYLRKELTAQRERYLDDTRIHCCLFFIQPSGHGLKPIDIVVLKKLTEFVNVVPVIAKSDSLTLDERANFKDRIKQELLTHGINLYPYVSDDQSTEETLSNKMFRAAIPFAIVGSETLERQSCCGIIKVEDPDHCEFTLLRNFLTRSHLQDLIETTSHIHYESFRSKQLLALKESAGAAPARTASPDGHRANMAGY